MDNFDKGENMDNFDKNMVQSMYGESSYGSSAFGGISQLPVATCPPLPKYSGNTVTLQATPKNGIGPYYVEFTKDGEIIDPSRLGGLSNPITTAPEDVAIIRIYTLDDADIASAFSGTINFSVYIEDSCPTSPQTCSETCIITIGCMAPVCNFTVT